MRRLGSLISLALSASLIVAFTYWYGGLQARTPASEPTAVVTASVEQITTPESGRKILYYRNPMGAARHLAGAEEGLDGDGLHPGLRGEEQDEPGTVKVSLDKIQRSGVRTEKVEATRRSSAPVRAVGTVEHDEVAA